MKKRGKAEARERQEETGTSQKGAWPQWLCKWWWPTVLGALSSYREIASLLEKLIWLAKCTSRWTCRSFLRRQQRRSQFTSSSSYQETSRGRGSHLVDAFIEIRTRNTLLQSSVRLQLLAKDLNLLYIFYTSLCCNQVTGMIHISKRDKTWSSVVNFNPLELFLTVARK